MSREGRARDAREVEGGWEGHAACLRGWMGPDLEMVLYDYVYAIDRLKPQVARRRALDERSRCDSPLGTWALV